MNINSRIAWAAVVAALGMVTTSRANVLVNGDFESPVISNGTYWINPTIPGWTTTSGPGIEIQRHVAGSPFEGDQHVELDSYANTAMEQSVATAPGSYVLSFEYSPRPGVSDASNGIEVYWNGSLIDTLALSGIGNADTVWSHHQYTVTASSVSTVGFAAIGTSDSLGGYIDDVRLSGVPDAGQGAGMLLGAASSLWALRRRR